MREDASKLRAAAKDPGDDARDDGACSCSESDGAGEDSSKVRWKELARLVYQDRTENADAAHALRLSKLPESAANGEAPPARDDSPLPDNFYE